MVKASLENDFFDNLDAVVVLTECDIYSDIDWLKASKRMRFPGWVFDSRLIVDEESNKFVLVFEGRWVL